MAQDTSQLSLSPEETRALAKEQGPLYRRIQAAMRLRIAEGGWAAGQGLPNRTQLCEEFGTTRVTMDKAIQGLISEGLLRATKRVGTFVAEKTDAGHSGTAVPNRAQARALPRTLRMGVVVERNSVPASDAMTFGENFYFGPLFQGIRDAVSSQPIDTVFAHLHRSEYLRFFENAVLDGMILITPSRAELPTLNSLTRKSVFYIATGISSAEEEYAQIPSMDTDNRQGARDAVRHLLALGHRQIAVVNLATNVANHSDRMDGCLETLTAAGLAVAPEDLVLLAQYDFKRFEERIEEWLTQALAAGTLPTAMFVCDYTMTLATLRVLRRHGLRVPNDISVVSFDDPLSAEHLTPPLTTVRQPVYQLGRRAAERLIAGLQGGGLLHGPEIFATELVVRESTCPPRTAAINRERIIP